MKVEKLKEALSRENEDYLDVRFDDIPKLIEAARAFLTVLEGMPSKSAYVQAEIKALIPSEWWER